jgi:RNA polymerase sigma-70 factor (ECF subfamily)
MLWVMTTALILRFAAGGNGSAAIALSGDVGSLSEGGRGNLTDRQQIIDLYDALRPSLYAYLCCLGLGPAEAEDTIQETFLRLVQHLSGHPNDKNLRGWIFRVARNLSVDSHRSDKRFVSDSDDDTDSAIQARIDPGPNPEQLVIQSEQAELLNTAVAQLTPQQRHCVLLRAEGLRYREIASVLGISVQRVGELVAKALVRLAGES